MGKSNDNNLVSAIVLGGLFIFLLLPLVFYFLSKVLIGISVIVLFIIIVQRFSGEEFIEESLLWFILFGCLLLALLSFYGGSVIETYINNNEFFSSLKKIIPVK